MRSEANVRRARAILAGTVLLLASAGCGVSDYENRMREEQARLEYFDREHQTLEGPVKWPEQKEEKKDDKAAADVIPPTMVFFRPPKGIATAPKPLNASTVRLLPGPNSQSPFQEVLLIVVKGKGREGFRTEVLKDLGLLTSPTEKPPLTPPGRKPMTFEHYRSEALNAYLYQDDIFQAAVVFRSAKPDLAAIDMSLGSLALGASASVQHQRYRPPQPPIGR